MKDDIPEIVDNPKAALESFIRELETYYYPWYDGTSTRNYYVWFVAQAMSLLAGFATALIAALLGTEQFKSWSTGRILLVVLPVLGSLASTYLLQSRIGELAGFLGKMEDSGFKNSRIRVASNLRLQRLHKNIRRFMLSSFRM